jgi:hypothetical protein
MPRCCRFFEAISVFKNWWQSFHIPSFSKMGSATCVHVHKCPPIPLEDFELGRLKPLSWSRGAISAAIVANIDRSCEKFQSSGQTYRQPKKELLSKRQKGAMDRFKYQGSWNLAQPDNFEDLNKFFDIFDDAYFGGLLKGYCRLEWIEESDTERRLEKGFDGVCYPYFPGEQRDPRFITEKPLIVITLLRHPGNDRFWAIHNYLEVLLHEMLHAIFDIYTCRCDNGCKQRHAREGGGGHWVEWQVAARNIEVADGKYWNLLGFGHDLRRTQSLVSDIQLGLNIPGPVELMKAGLDIKVIREELAEKRKAMVQAEIERRPKLKQLKANVCLLHYRTRDIKEWRRFHIDFPTLFEPTIPW